MYSKRKRKKKEQIQKNLKNIKGLKFLRNPILRKKNPYYLRHLNKKTLINSKKERIIDYPENIKSKSFKSLREYHEQINPRNNSQYISNDQYLAIHNEVNMSIVPNTKDNLILDNNHEFI